MAVTANRETPAQAGITGGLVAMVVTRNGQMARVKKDGLTLSLKCLNTRAWSKGNKQEEFKICIRLYDYDIIASTETW